MNRLREYLERDVDQDAGLASRWLEASRIQRGRLTAVASGVGRTIMDGLSGAIEHPVAAVSLEAASLVGGIALGGLVFSQRR